MKRGVERVVDLLKRPGTQTNLNKHKQSLSPSSALIGLGRGLIRPYAFRSFWCVLERFTAGFYSTLKPFKQMAS
nr:MAG TPA: hypothetical protein [Caudoviricetes sp.]